jgi:F-type H+-transporting ATPase subunit a
MVNRSTTLPLAILLGSLLLLGGGVAWAQHGDDAPQDQAEAEHTAQATAHESEHGEAAEHGETAGHDEAAGHGGEHSDIPHLTNILGYVAGVLTDEQGEPTAVAHFLKDFTDPIFSLFVAMMIAIFFIWLSRRLDARHPGRLQMAVELILGGLYGMFGNIIGPTARRYTPYLGTLFIFILVNNLIGMVPLGHSSTASFQNTTFALGMATFLYVQAIAIKENGILGFLHHLAGSPRTKMDWGFSLLLFPLHVLGELIKPISLSLRLFGNIFGEDTLIATMIILGTAAIYSLTGSQFVPGIPFQFPFYFLGMLTSTIQALVFTLLSTVYIALMLPHDEHAHEEAHGH